MPRLTTTESDVQSKSLIGCRLTFVVNHAAFFVSHRLPLALAAEDRGYSVNLLTGQAGSSAMESVAVSKLISAEIEHDRVAFSSAGMNPFLELWGVFQLVSLLREKRPHLVHCVSPKGVLYGGIASRVMGVKGLVLAVSGMGYAFTASREKTILRTFIAKIYRLLARLAFGHSNKRVIVQNLDDQAEIIESGLAKPNEVRLIQGSGVDLSCFADIVIEDKLPAVLLPARMLEDKGIFEFVEAAKQLKDKTEGWKFILAGTADYQNPSSVPREQIQEWQEEGLLDWLGHIDDMVPIYGMASIVCLPSYREGMPKVLLEAAAAGCAIVTTDAIGCREAIVPGETGDLVPVQNSEKLARVLISLIRDKPRRERYGYAGRRLAYEKYGLDSVVEKTIKIYEELLCDA